MEEPWGSPEFVAEKFRNWYRFFNTTIPAPLDIVKREFAFILFYGKGIRRHIALPTETKLHQFFRTNTPMHAYHSSSYYSDPEADMSKKGWEGADLVFDIDADHFDLPCQKVHDRWWCKNCDEKGFGNPPDICTCGRAQYTSEVWLCEKCLQAAKHETQKLLDILITDFGVKIEQLQTNFSGNRGYHVHVQSENYKQLDQNARREIVDYIMAIGLEAEFQGFNRRNKGVRSTLSAEGWRGRTVRAFYDYLSNSSETEIRGLKLGRNTTKNILSRKEEILDTLITKHPSNILPLIDPKSLKKILSEAIKLQASEIDTVVTTDIHRLIRIPNTLHGKTAWQVQTIPYGQLSSYDPFTKAVIINGPSVKIEFKNAPKIKILDTWYGPYEEEKAELPLEAALFFLCKKGARISK